MVGVAARVGRKDPYAAQIEDACAFAEPVPLPGADQHPLPDTDEQRFQFWCHRDLDLLTSDPANLVRSLGDDDNRDPQLTAPDQPGRAISTEEWA
jgi:hypothetical protein